MQIKRLSKNIAERQKDNFSAIRSQHPEFNELSYNQMSIYIDQYDRNKTMGFAPNSMTCMVGGCFVLFCSWLLFNAQTEETQR